LTRSLYYCLFDDIYSVVLHTHTILISGELRIQRNVSEKVATQLHRSLKLLPNY